MPEMIKPIGKDLVPFFNLSENPQVWADDFLKMESAEAEYFKLKNEYEQVRKSPRTKTDQIKILKTAYNEHQKSIANQLAALLSEHGADTLNRLPHLQNNPINSIIPQEIFEAALEQLPPDPPEALTDEQRRKKLDAIQKKMAQEKDKIKKFTPQSYIQFRNGNVQCDSRREFVNFWRDKQAWIARPCDPRGIDLELASDDVKWLYKKANIAACILDKAQKLPHRP